MVTNVSMGTCQYCGKSAKTVSDEVFSRGRQQWKVKARSLLCFWAVREAGMSQRELARRLEMSGPGVGFAVERGAAIARENNYSLLE